VAVHQWGTVVPLGEPGKHPMHTRGRKWSIRQEFVCAQLALDHGAHVCPNGPPMHYGSVDLHDLISVRAASDQTGIPRRRIYKWIARDAVWSIKVGNVIMLHKKDVEAWIGEKAS